MTYGVLAICARNIRRLRSEKHWSQEKLAERSGLHRTYVGGIERAERNFTLANLEIIARALGASPADLLRER